MSENNMFQQYAIDRPISIACAIIITVVSSLGLLLSNPVNILSLIPVNTFIANRFVWNVITCAFYEKYLVKIIFDCILVIFTVKKVEFQSKEQFGLYMLAGILVTSFCTSAFYIISFFITKVEAPLVQPTYGFSGVYIMLLTYCRCQYANESVNFAFPQITYQNLPIIYLLIQAIFMLLNLHIFSKDILFSIISLFVSWTYLRFIYRFHEDGPLGNQADEFAFVAMFPDALRPVTIPLTTAFYNMVVMTGAFPPLDPEEKKPQHHLRYHNSSPSLPISIDPRSPPPSSPDPLQERRRAKAMKLLDAKLAQLSKEGDGWEVTDAKDLEEIEFDDKALEV